MANEIPTNKRYAPMFPFTPSENHAAGGYSRFKESIMPASPFMISSVSPSMDCKKEKYSTKNVSEKIICMIFLRFMRAVTA